MRGYDTLFVQRVKSANHESSVLRAFAKLCVREQQPISKLAASFGVSRTTVYNWMTGQAVPRPRHLATMKTALQQHKQLKRK